MQIAATYRQDDVMSFPHMAVANHWDSFFGGGWPAGGSRRPIIAARSTSRISRPETRRRSGILFLRALLISFSSGIAFFTGCAYRDYPGPIAAGIALTDIRRKNPAPIAPIWQHSDHIAEASPVERKKSAKFNASLFKPLVKSPIYSQ